MIFKKGDRWKISGYASSYATLVEAERVLAKLGLQATAIAEKVASEAIKEAEKVAIAEIERLEKLSKLAIDSTPYEKMIAKNICTTCDMEPCECFTYTKKTDLGD
jgi:hypothetical protein